MRWIVWIIAVLGMVSCKSVKYVPQKNTTNTNDSIISNNTEYESKKESIENSSHYKDSTVITLDANGNVIMKEVYRTKEIYRNSDKNSTFQRNTDSKETSNHESESIIKEERTIWRKLKSNALYIIILIVIVPILIKLFVKHF